MQSILSRWKYWTALFSVLLGLAAIFQTYRTTDAYIRLWREPLWRMRSMDSFERSAVLYLKPYGAKFMDFIDSVVPPGGSVVTTVNSSVFSFQNILQFFLGNQRTIISCPESGAALSACLRAPDLFVPVMKGFPPANLDLQKKFIPYNPADFPLDGIESTNDAQYKGIYAPQSGPISSGITLQTPASYHPLVTLLLDLCTLVGIACLGILLAALVLKEPGLQQALILAIPLGAGLVSWVLFLLAWMGLPFTLALVILVFLVLFAVLLFLRWRQTRPNFHLLRFDRPVWPKTIRQGNWPVIAAALALAFLGIAGLIISIGRGYSLYDDIAIWSLKGYVIADHHSLLAAGKSSGHGLAYPLNLSLNVAVFRLISGDLLPGSKFIFFFLTVSLLAGAYRFWRHFGVPAVLALLGILALISVPAIYQHATFGFANLPFTAYLVLGALWSIEGLLENNRGALWIGGLLLGFAGWTRPEGIGYALSVAVSLAIFQWLRRGSLKDVLPWLAIAALIPGVWFIFSSQFVSQDQVGGAFSAMRASLKAGDFKLENIPYLYRFFIDRLQDPKVWGYLLPVVVLIALLSFPKWISRPNPAAFLLLPAALITIFGPLILFYVEFFQNTDYATFLITSFDRAFFPAAFFFAILAVTLAGYRETPAPA